MNISTLIPRVSVLGCGLAAIAIAVGCNTGTNKGTPNFGAAPPPPPPPPPPATSSPNAPVANFTGTPENGDAPLEVQFTDSSTNTPTSWLWEFGDGSTSTEQNPKKTYQSVGTFTVKLTATNAFGSSVKTRSDLITAADPNACTQPPNTWFVGQDPSSSFVVNTPAEKSLGQELLTLLNQERITGTFGTGGIGGGGGGIGTTGLVWDDQLELTAKVHAADMAARNYLSHTSPEGCTLTDRLKMTSVTTGISAESIARGHSTASGVFNAWKNNNTDRSHMINQGFIKVGIGLAPDGTGGFYWVAVYALK